MFSPCCVCCFIDILRGHSTALGQSRYWSGAFETEQKNKDNNISKTFFLYKILQPCAYNIGYTIYRCIHVSMRTQLTRYSVWCGGYKRTFPNAVNSTRIASSLLLDIPNPLNDTLYIQSSHRLMQCHRSTFIANVTVCSCSVSRLNRIGGRESPNEWLRVQK